MSKITKVEEIYEVQLTELDLHPLAKTTPRMTNENYTALKADIELNGQLDPITLYRGRVLDGRHRLLILNELGNKTINAIKLPHNTSAGKLKSIVQSKEIRRHETPTQLAITAYNLMLDSSVKLTQSEASIQVGANIKKVSNCKTIASTHNRPDILQLLFNGDKLNIGTTYEPFKTDSLPAILDWLKSLNKETTNKDIRGKVEMTEDQFNDCALRVTELTGLDIKQIKHISTKLYFHIKEYEVTLSEPKGT
jgi:hypothetical protein